MCILAVQALLETIYHGFPVEVAFVGDAAAVRKLGEIYLVG